MKIEYMRNSLLILFALCFLNGLWGQANKPQKSPPQTITPQDDALTRDPVDRWHRLYVKAWNEWMRDTNITPEFAAKEKVLQKIKADVQNEIKKNKRALVLAQTSNAIVNFVAEKKLEANPSKSISENGHRLTIRVLSWPKFLVNGNTFEYSEKNSLQENYSLLQKNHHYKKLASQETKKEFALAALSYMVALKKADQVVKQGSKLKMQKPSTAQLAGADKGVPSNIPGLPEGVTMMNMGNPRTKSGFAVEATVSSPKLSLWERGKAFLKMPWFRTTP